jgi:hypothetical protein
MEDRQTPRIYKYGKTKIDSNYDGNCTSRDCLCWTYEISGRLIFVEQRFNFALKASMQPFQRYHNSVMMQPKRLTHFPCFHFPTLLTAYLK